MILRGHLFNLIGPWHRRGNLVCRVTKWAWYKEKAFLIVILVGVVSALLIGFLVAKLPRNDTMWLG